MTSYPPVGAVGTDSLRLSANSLKFNPYLQADSLGYNPYLYADSLGYANLNQYNTDSIPYTNPVMGTTSPSFQGLPADSLNASYNYANTSTEKKGGVNPWVVTAGVTLLTVGAACYLKGRGVNANGSFLEKLKAGGEANWKSITNFFKGGEKAAEGVGKKATSSAQAEALDSVITIRHAGKKGGTTVVSVPGKERIVNAEQAKNLGIVPENIDWNHPTAILDKTWIEFTVKGEKFRAFYKNGEIKNVFTKSGNKITGNDAINKELEQIVQSIANKKLPKGVQLLETRFNTIVDGSRITYRTNYANTKLNGNSITTNRYKHTEDPVQALAADNAEFKKMLENIKGQKPNYEGLTIGSAIYTPKSLGNGTQIVIKNGEITGVNVKNPTGIYEFHEFDSEKCKALLNKHESIFKNALNNQNKFEQVAYTLPT